MSIKKIMRSVPSEPLAANGLLYHDFDAITQCQRECARRLCISIQLEQESYLSQHPEVLIRCSDTLPLRFRLTPHFVDVLAVLVEAGFRRHTYFCRKLVGMMELYVCRMALQNKRKCNFLKEAADYFLQDDSLLDSDIRKHLKIGPTGPYTQGKKESFYYDDMSLVEDLKTITAKHFPPQTWLSLSSRASPPNTESSSFLSIQTSATTIPTPEPVPTPPLTFSETVFSWVSNTVDKAIFLKVDTGAILYDTAYVELSKAVETAMEIPVIEIRADIGSLLFEAYQNFLEVVIYKEQVAAEIAWQKRMRKKMKKSLRRQNNFKGYETPPTPKSVISSHESYKKPPPPPCQCQPQFYFNRYGKDRFGIYLPRDQEFSKDNITVTPAISLESLDGEATTADETGTDGKIASQRKGSLTSTKTTTSVKSTRSHKSGRSAFSGKTAVTIKSVTSVRSIQSDKSNPMSVKAGASVKTDTSEKSNATS